MRSETITQILNLYKDSEIIARTDIKELYTSHYNSGDNSTLDSRINKMIYRLKNKGVLTSLKSGFYQTESKKTFLPPIDRYQQKINQIFKKHYPDLSYSVWATQSLQQFMNLQPLKNFYIFETEKDIIDSVFYLFRENKINAFINPSRDIMEKYVINSRNALIIKPLISRSPLIEVQAIHTPRLEKVLVDIFYETQIFYSYQGAELINIFENAFRFYHIDYSRLLNYADRRKLKSKISIFLKDKIANAKLNLLP
jgi:predicted Zn-dependent protease